MKKSSFVAMILGTISGIIIGLVGIIVLMSLIPLSIGLK